MATSTEKLLLFLEQLQDRDDDELAQMLPAPPRVVRMALGGAALRVPEDPAMLDDYALAAARFVLSMRSDDAPVVELVVDGEVVRLVDELEAPEEAPA